MECIDCWKKLDKTYEQKMNGIKIKSKCDWFKSGERSSKCFLNLEKSKAVQSTIWNIAKDKKNPYMSCQVKKINEELFKFYKTYLQKILICPRMKLWNF